MNYCEDFDIFDIFFFDNFQHFVLGCKLKPIQIVQFFQHKLGVLNPNHSVQFDGLMLVINGDGFNYCVKIQPSSPTRKHQKHGPSFGFSPKRSFFGPHSWHTCNRVVMRQTRPLFGPSFDSLIPPSSPKLSVARNWA